MGIHWIVREKTYIPREWAQCRHQQWPETPLARGYSSFWAPNLVSFHLGIQMEEWEKKKADEWDLQIREQNERERTEKVG